MRTLGACIVLLCIDVAPSRLSKIVSILLVALTPLFMLLLYLSCSLLMHTASCTDTYASPVAVFCPRLDC